MLPPNLVSVAVVHDQNALPPSVESVALAMKEHGFEAKYHTIKVTFTNMIFNNLLYIFKFI